MRLFLKFPSLLLLCLFMLPSCGFDAVSCGPGEIKQDGECILLELNDDEDATEETDGPGASEPKMMQARVPTKTLPRNHLSPVSLTKIMTQSNRNQRLLSSLFNETMMASLVLSCD